ncbi:hypothetical protein LTR86_009234 [Recurvomyces mirabilis]|nr:hypothetical protein LTR86_009234 [Recurvomyces mirabilis]
MPEMQQNRDNRASLLASVTAAATDPDPHQPSSLPPWVHINTSNSTRDIPNASALPLATPQNTHQSLHTHTGKRGPGRKWDSLRTAEPALLSADIHTHQERWRDFMESGPNAVEQQRRARVVSQAWMDENMPYLNPGWKEEDEWVVDGLHGAGAGGKGFSGLMYGGKWLISPERQEKTIRLFWRLLLKNPFVPLAFRLTILAFSAAALGVAATIYTSVFRVNHDNDPSNQCATRASTYMAICVGSVAIPYLCYVTWDEYMTFAASNISLAFDALYDHRWACYDDQYAIIGDSINYKVPSTCPNNPDICRRQVTLAAILLISLVAWLITFSLSVMRVVEKLRPD